MRWRGENEEEVYVQGEGGGAHVVEKHQRLGGGGGDTEQARKENPSVSSDVFAKNLGYKEI